MDIDPDEAVDEMYRLLTSLIVPRPIGWVSTRSTDGVDNLAPFSFYMGVIEADPPVVMFSAEHRSDGTLKDSARNAVETEAFGLNLVTADLVEQMDGTSRPVDPETDEFDVVGLDRREATTIDVPLVAAAKATMECSLHDTMEVGDHTVVFGRIERIHVDDELLTDGKIDIEKVDAVGRLSGSYYARLEPFTVERDWVYKD
ncbi:NADH-FMN oxidoreductase RutF, flavin reductase (DIM6/NTAB) family [Halogranum gelatinilyticum]|uniref:NADH-FMN oxidoreductase RutF, flavin reductase (DIM6/NTAB) family n=1 Tax=Halogranum gelatinilyticum TaxID=660521 RepID=A0A1G9Q6C9_9EURY|nr:flavin reductase family protein [Halogranum gelatinilyticum]SDM06588.1 NADH-FMN oxidoreductase RutF, flavin reductase (DIM6/NTAB) family [Halogranum gelatinilyticum]